MQKTTVGSIEIVALVDLVHAYPASTVYPEIGDSARFARYLEADGGVALGFACYLLRDGATTLLEGASGFTTIEVKSNFLGTATEGSLIARATMAHGGRTTQVWDAPVIHEQSGKTIALFRCTQMVLWPK